MLNKVDLEQKQLAVRRAMCGYDEVSNIVPLTELIST